jgi:hypothetical protein
MICKLSVAAIYSVFSAAAAADLDEIRGSTPNYVDGHSRPIGPTGSVDSGPTGLPSHFNALALPKL